jgi:FAD:protein FMN transferase
MDNELKFKKELFGGFIEIVLYDIDKLLGKLILEDTYNEALRLQKIFNFFDNKSELSMLNLKRDMIVSDDLYNVIIKALKFSEITNGNYDITLGKNILKRKKGEEINNIGGSYKDVKIEGKRIILNKKDLLIDLGSIAKGYITDKIAEFLKLQGIEEGMIDSRGDILFFGDYEHIIEVQDPRDKDKFVCKVKIKNQGIATSGDYKQFDKSYAKSHILNQKDLISVTVIANTLEEADLYATVIFVSSPDQIEKLIEENKTIKVLILDKELSLKMYNGFEDLIYMENK